MRKWASLEIFKAFRAKPKSCEHLKISILHPSKGKYKLLSIRINSSYNFYALLNREVWELWTVSTRGYCLDIIPNSQEYPTKKSMIIRERISFHILGTKGFIKIEDVCLKVYIIRWCEFWVILSIYNKQMIKLLVFFIESVIIKTYNLSISRNRIRKLNVWSPQWLDIRTVGLDNLIQMFVTFLLHVHL